jgi:uncharacterized protein YllA (UPF0747 family)
MAQTRELYDYFDTKMPAVWPRHSATLINRKFSGFLEERNMKPWDFFRTFDLIEKMISSEFSDDGLEKYFNSLEKEIMKIYDEAGEKVSEIEPSLRRSAESLAQKSLNILSSLEKKAQSAARKKSKQQINKYRQAASFLYPDQTLQERIFSPINFAVFDGFDPLNETISEICEFKADRHYFPELF